MVIKILSQGSHSNFHIKLTLDVPNTSPSLPVTAIPSTNSLNREQTTFVHVHSWTMYTVILHRVGRQSPLPGTYKSAVHTTYSTVHTAYSEVHTTYSTVHTAYSEVHATYSTVHTAYSEVHTTYSAVHTTYSEVHTTYSAVHTTYSEVHTTYSAEHSTHNYLILEDEGRLICSLLPHQRNIDTVSGCYCYKGDKSSYK